MGKGSLLNELHEKLTRAFVDLFTTNVPDRHLGTGGEGYYGVCLDSVAPDGSGGWSCPRKVDTGL